MYVWFNKYHQATFVVCNIQYIWTDIRTDCWDKIHLISIVIHKISIFRSTILSKSQDLFLMELIFRYKQGRSEGTSSVAFEVLIISCQISFITLFIFNSFQLNIKLLIFKLFDVKFLFTDNYVFRKQKRTTVYGLMDTHP